MPSPLRTTRLSAAPPGGAFAPRPTHPVRKGCPPCIVCPHDRTSLQPHEPTRSRASLLGAKSPTRSPRRPALSPRFLMSSQETRGEYA